MIFVTIELRHAPWFGPFRDLSAPDPTSIINLFGLLPFEGPEPGSLMALIFVGILPLLLGISMWLQQKLNPAPTDPTQQMIFLPGCPGCSCSCWVALQAGWCCTGSPTT
ncbi:hypothetical protein ACFOHS_15440 [Jhaorihella thermophila]